MYTKANLASLRVKKDIAELSRQRFNASHASTSIDFPDGTRNVLKLKVGVSITAGLYEGATFYFLLTIPPSYPFHAPSVVCTTRAWHPNIDLHTGFVSLPILSKDWRPVLSINCVVFALQLMFLEPVEDLAVNDVATAALANPEVYREQVRRTLAGGFLFGVQFEPHTRGSGLCRGEPGTAPKRKRAEGMDTDAVQSTLQAMRIQGDEGAEDTLAAWDKRPRYTEQSAHVLAADQRRHEQQQQQLQQQFPHAIRGTPIGPLSASLAGTSGSFASGPNNHRGATGISILPPREIHQSHHDLPQSFSQHQQLEVTATFAQGSTSFRARGGAGPDASSSNALDTLRFRALGETETGTATPGLRCNQAVAVPQGPQAGVGVGAQTATGATAVGWGGGQYQALPATRSA